MTPLDPKKPVTIESLLQIKRSERPPREFWQQFDSELRAKQLAAIVGPRPWYSLRNVRRLGAVLPVSVGTAAAIGAAFISVHEFRASAGRTAPASIVARAVENQHPALVASAGPSDRVPAVATEARTLRSAPTTAVAPKNLGEADHLLAANAEATTVVLTAMPSRSAFPDPFSGAMTENAPLPEASSSLTATSTGPSGAQWTVATYTDHPVQAEPLAHTVTMADERRAALLSDPLPNSATAWAATTASDQHEVSQLSEDRLYQAVRRLGVGGDRLLIRF